MNQLSNVQAPVRELLDAVWFSFRSLQEAKKKYANQLAPDFSLVDHLRNDEMALSRYLALLLDTQGSHAQGDLFLRHFVKEMGECADWINPNELIGITLERQANGQRRLDIYLEFKNGVVGIENKPRAGEPKNQLRDYAGWLKAQASGKNWLLIYACNNDPSANSISSEYLKEITENNNYYRMDFYQIVEWLEHCAGLAKAPKIRFFAEELSAYIRRTINGELEMTEAREIKDLLLQKDEHIESAFKVVSSVKELQTHLLNEFRYDFSEKLKEHGISIVWEDDKIKNRRAWAGFGALFSPEHQVHLRFEFGGSGLDLLEWGIRANSEKVAIDPANAAIVRAAMEGVFGISDSAPIWPWYCSKKQNDEVLAVNERNWSNNAEPWLRMRDTSEKGFVHRFVELAKKVKKTLEAEEVDAAMR